MLSVRPFARTYFRLVPWWWWWVCGESRRYGIDFCGLETTPFTIHARLSCRLMSCSQELFDEYESQTRKELHGQLVGLDTALCTREYFIRIWAQEFPHLKLKPSGDFMLCKICTLLKSAIFGTQSGSRGIQDEAERSLKKKEYEDHIEVRIYVFAICVVYRVIRRHHNPTCFLNRLLSTNPGMDVKYILDTPNPLYRTSPRRGSSSGHTVRCC